MENHHSMGTKFQISNMNKFYRSISFQISWSLFRRDEYGVSGKILTVTWFGEVLKCFRHTSRILFSIPISTFIILREKWYYSPFFIKTRTLRKLNNLLQNTQFISYGTYIWSQFYLLPWPELLDIEKG